MDLQAGIIPPVYTRLKNAQTALITPTKMRATGKPSNIAAPAKIAMMDKMMISVFIVNAG